MREGTSRIPGNESKERIERKNRKNRKERGVYETLYSVKSNMG